MTVVLNVHGRPHAIDRTETAQNGLFAFDVPANTYDLQFHAPVFRSVVKMVRAFSPDSAVRTVRLQVAPTYSPTVIDTTSGFAQGQDKSQGQKPKQPGLWAAIAVPQPIYVEGYETERLQIFSPSTMTAIRRLALTWNRLACS